MGALVPIASSKKPSANNNQQGFSLYRLAVRGGASIGRNLSVRNDRSDLDAQDPLKYSLNPLSGYGEMVS